MVFDVETKELSITKDGGLCSIVVHSGAKWEVSSMPQWISLQSINHSSYSPYEWTVSFSASANDEYNREGEIVIKASSGRIAIDVTQEGPKGVYVPVESITLSLRKIVLSEDESISLAYEIKPSNATVKDVSWYSSNLSVATVTEGSVPFIGIVTAKSDGIATITVTADGGKTDYCSVVVATGPEAVDLGLSVKWSSLNYGASSVTSVGGYYMWGDPTGMWQGSTPPNVTNISGSQYDIVRNNWGGNWRIPTYDEVEELYKNCTWSLTTINGVSVLEVTGLNGASIYLPFTGCKSTSTGEITDNRCVYIMTEHSYYDSLYGYRMIFMFCFSSEGNKSGAWCNPSYELYPIRPVQ